MARFKLRWRHHRALPSNRERAAGRLLRLIAEGLTADGTSTVRGGAKWSTLMVQAVLNGQHAAKVAGPKPPLFELNTKFGFSGDAGVAASSRSKATAKPSTMVSWAGTSVVSQAMQNVAAATYRQILEQRAQENAVDFVNGVATAITPMAFFETVMAKGYETLVDSDTEVDVNTGMIAAGRLQALIESRASGTRIADLMVQMGRIIDAIHDTVPPELWPEILRKIEGPVAADTSMDEFDECDDAQDMYDAMESEKADEECWTASARRDSRAGRRAPTRTIEAPYLAIREFTPKPVKDEDDI